MNKGRRKKLESLASQVDAIIDEVTMKAVDEEVGDADPDLTGNVKQWQKRLDDILSEVESLKEEEDDYRLTMPESLQNSQNYSISEDASEAMEEALENLTELVNCETEDFNEFFHEKAEDISSRLNDAAA